jgi:cytidylate kinase
MPWKMTYQGKFFIIAIDGGAASGKSSTARAVAERLNLLHVDTGSHYRAITHFLLSAGIAAEAGPALDDALHAMQLSTEVDGRAAVMLLEGRRCAQEDLRSQAVNAQVSQFAGLPAVRQALFNYQRSQPEVARSHGFNGIVMEGRDIGSVILPDAPFRFFLFADSETRSARRAAEGQSDSISQRDALDSGRKTAPLLCPDGAMRIDTGSLSLAAVVDLICQMVEEECNEPA